MQVLMAFHFVMVSAYKCKNQSTPTAKSAEPLINNLWKPDRNSRQKRQNTRRQIPPVPLVCQSFSVCEQACKHDPRHRRHQPEADFFKCRHHKNPFFRNMSSVSSIDAHATAPVKKNCLPFAQDIALYQKNRCCKVDKNSTARTTQAA
jgi:hypothetical protein